jgi:hypothetical protein
MRRCGRVSVGRAGPVVVSRISGYDIPVIKTFACRDTEALFNGMRVRRFVNIEGPARRKLEYLDAAGVLETFVLRRAIVWKHSRVTVLGNTAFA